MDELKDIICRELEEIANKGELSAGELDTVYKLIVAKEKLLRIEELEGDLGYSQDGGWNAAGTYKNRNSYGQHYVRGHYSNGHYSMDDGKEYMVEQMQEMLKGGNLNSSQKTTLRKAMEILQR